jgi:6-phosphogluconolactonase (cycloisomerase 2 family)
MPRLERGRCSVKRFSKVLTKATLLAAPLVVFLVVAALGGAANPPNLLSETNCVSNGGTGGCDSGFVLDNPQGLAVASDGSRVFVATADSNALAVFLRGSKSGKLTQYPGNENRDACTSQDGSGGQCQDGHGFVGPMDVVNVSNSVYVASQGSNAIDILEKDTDSRQFEQDPGTAGCINEGGTDGCAAGKGLTGARSLAVNPQGGGNFVYVGGDHTIAEFKRSVSNGSLTQFPPNNTFPSTDACINDDGSDGCTDGFVPGDVVSMQFSTDGKYLYAAVSGSPGAVLIFFRLRQGPLRYQGCVSDGGAGGCQSATNLDNPTGVGLDRSGKNVYVASRGSGAVTVFSRNQQTGAMTQLGGTQFISNVNRISVAPNNKSAYATSDVGVWSFTRNKKTGGALTQVDCVTDSGGCTAPAGNGLAGAIAVVPASGQKDVYVIGATDDAVVALKHT